MQSEKLLKDAEFLGISVNGTWGDARIQKEIDAKLSEDGSGEDKSGNDETDGTKPEAKTKTQPKTKGKSMTLKNKFVNPVNINGLRFKGKQTRTLTPEEVKQGGKRLIHAINVKLLKNVGEA